MPDKSSIGRCRQKVPGDLNERRVKGNLRECSRKWERTHTTQSDWKKIWNKKLVMRTGSQAIWRVQTWEGSGGQGNVKGGGERSQQPCLNRWGLWMTGSPENLCENWTSELQKSNFFFIVCFVLFLGLVLKVKFYCMYWKVILRDFTGLPSEKNKYSYFLSSSLHFYSYNWEQLFFLGQITI